MSLQKIVLVELQSLGSFFNLTYLWNMGSLLGLILVFQILTGFILTLFYSSDVSMRFQSLEILERTLERFYYERLCHVIGVNFFFLILYLHLLRGFFLGSFRFADVWASGVSIFILLMAVAFLGYVLPYGQMSLWGATVITNLVRVVPLVGMNLLLWLWWGFSVGGLTCKLFFRLHFLLPFVLVVVVMVHLLGLHFSGSSNMVLNLDAFTKKSFDVFFVVKDLVLFFCFIFYLAVNKDMFLDPENYLEANSMVSPVHIKPEWYFLFVYAILRSVPQKRLGVVSLVIALVVLYMLSISVSVMTFGMWFFRFLLSVLVLVVFILLTWVGGMPVEYPFIYLGQFLMCFYFLMFYIVFVWLGAMSCLRV